MYTNRLYVIYGGACDDDDDDEEFGARASSTDFRDRGNRRCFEALSCETTRRAFRGQDLVFIPLAPLYFFTLTFYSLRRECSIFCTVRFCKFRGRRRAARGTSTIAEFSSPSRALSSGTESKRTSKSTSRLTHLRQRLCNVKAIKCFESSSPSFDMPLRYDIRQQHRRVSQSRRCKIPRVPVVTTKSRAFLAAPAGSGSRREERRCCIV